MAIDYFDLAKIAPGDHPQSRCMKRILVLLLGFAAFALMPLLAQTSPLLAQAQRAYVTGDLATAKSLFQQVLVADPQNVTARNFLKAITVAESQIGPGAASEKQLQRLILPKVDFSNATLDSTLDALRQQASKVSGGKIEPSFVVQPGVNVSTPVTLHLSGVPFSEVLRYVGELVKADFVVDRYAITVRPKAAAAPAPTTHQ